MEQSTLFNASTTYDIKINETVKWKDNDTTLFRKGVVKYVGEVFKRVGIWCGIKVTVGKGNTDGIMNVNILQKIGDKVFFMWRKWWSIFANRGCYCGRRF